MEMESDPIYFVDRIYHIWKWSLTLFYTMRYAALRLAATREAGMGENFLYQPQLG